jgi:hypothetical protein
MALHPATLIPCCTVHLVHHALVLQSCACAENRTKDRGGLPASRCKDKRTSPSDTCLYAEGYTSVTGAWPFLAIGLLLLGLVLFLLRRSIVLGQDSSESSQNDEFPDAFQAELFPQKLAARLFGLEDWKFIAKQGSAPLRGVFLQQRTPVALFLLRSVRANATRLIRVHSAAARTNFHLEPLVELRVVADYLSIQLLCQVLALWIWLRGPVDLIRLVGYADDLSKQLCDLTMRVFPPGLTAEETKRQPYLFGGRRRG